MQNVCAVIKVGTVQNHLPTFHQLPFNGESKIITCPDIWLYSVELNIELLELIVLLRIKRLMEYYSVESLESVELGVEN